MLFEVIWLALRILATQGISVLFSFQVDRFNQFVLVWFHCEITYLYDFNIYILYTYAFVELGPAFPHDVAPGEETRIHDTCWNVTLP
jgi:hypothetical protein